MRTKQPTSLLRILTTILVSLIVILLLYRIWDSDYGYIHRKHFASNSELHLNFDELNIISVDQSQKDYPINWFCRHDNSIPDFGDYVCADELKSWNNIPALTVVFWFKDKKLNNAKIDVPYWNHNELITEIKNKFGNPVKKSHRYDYIKLTKILALVVLTKGKYQSKNDNINIDDLGLWELESGGLLITQLNQGDNPFSWNTLFWIPPHNEILQNSISTDIN